MTTRFGSKLKKETTYFLLHYLKVEEYAKDIVNSYKYSEARRFAI